MQLTVSYKGEEQLLAVKEENVILFPNGLVGCPQWRRFVLLEDPEAAPVAILQCLDDTNISFLVTDPCLLSPDYAVHLANGEAGALGLAAEEDARLLCILSIKEGPVMVTANLVAPVLINATSRTASQVILQDSAYSTQHPVLKVKG